MKTVLILLLEAWLLMDIGVAGCPYTEKELRAEVKDCIHLGNRFIRRYDSYLNKRSRAIFETCKDFAAFRQCITPLVDECPLLRQQLSEHWIPVLNHLTCTCSSAQIVGKNALCKRETKCFEGQSKDVLSRHCVYMNTFNRKQKTQSQCFFLRDMVECKYLLIKSACGETVAELGKHVEIISQSLKGHKCDLVKKPENYKGFEYSDKCPVDISKRIELCQNKLKRVQFYEYNSLITDATIKNTKKACREYMKYKKCVRPVRASCPRGVTLLDETDRMRRVYNMRMEYVCREEKELYLKYLYCYQEVVVNNKLQSCMHIWNKASLLLNTTVSFDYYCLPNLKKVQMIKNFIAEITRCHRLVYADECGDTAAGVMNELMIRVFKDPAYVKMRVKPHSCSRHLAVRGGPDVSRAAGVARTEATPPAVTWPDRLLVTLSPSALGWPTSGKNTSGGCAVAIYARTVILAVVILLF